MQPIAVSHLVRQAQLLEAPQPAPAQRRPGVRSPNTVRHSSIGSSLRKETPIKLREVVGLRLAPHTPLGLGAGKIAQQFLSRGLSAGSDAMRDVGPRHHKVAAIGSASPHEDMGMGLVGVEVAGRKPGEPRLLKVGRDLVHHVAHIARQIGYPLAMLWRDDQPKMVAILLPPADDLPRI